MKVRMHRVTCQRAPQNLQTIAERIDAAAQTVRQRDHAIDIRIVSERVRMHIAPEMIGDRARDGGRAVHARQHAAEIACRDAPAIALDAHERCRLIDEQRRMFVDTELVLAREIGHRQIVRVHVLSARDRLARHADDLVVALDRLARNDIARRDLWPGGISPATTRSSDAIRAPDTS